MRRRAVLQRAGEPGIDPLPLGDGRVLSPTVLAGADEMASIMTKGDPVTEHDRALRVLGDWLATTGRHLDGPGREILHADPDTPAGYLLQLQYPTCRRHTGDPPPDGT